MSRAALHPRTVRDGDDLTVRVTGFAGLASAPASIQVVRVDSVETAWTATFSAKWREDGTLEGTWAGLGVPGECALLVQWVEIDGDRQHVEETEVTIANPTTPIAGGSDALARHAELKRGQEARYDSPLGDPAAADAVEHRVVCAVERLLVTTPLRLPGVQVLPVSERPSGAEERTVIDQILQGLGWPTRVNVEEWSRRIASNRPWTAIVCAPVWAAEQAEAAAIAWKVRDDLLAVLGLNRGVRGRPIATVIEQRQADDSVKSGVYVEDTTYRGNFLGGFIAGEDQRHLLAQHAAMRRDPLLRLCVDLYSEALADPSPDARYLRLWSVLETLSTARLPPDELVTRLDGTAWPGDANTTRFAAPRVYALLKQSFVEGAEPKLNEANAVAPAADLYEAVRAWYARRNATAHYGRFDTEDDRQRSKNWFQYAERTLRDDPASADQWLRSCERHVEQALQRELRALGASAVDD